MSLAEAVSGFCSSCLTSELHKATRIKTIALAVDTPHSKQQQPPSPQMSSPSRIPSSGPNDSTLTYPPTATVKADKQPAPKTEMSLRPGQETGARRLRGGCIPCPVRVTTDNFPLIVHCSFTDHRPDRMVDSASASPAAADRRM